MFRIIKVLKKTGELIIHLRPHQNNISRIIHYPISEDSYEHV